MRGVAGCYIRWYLLFFKSISQVYVGLLVTLMFIPKPVTLVCIYYTSRAQENIVSIFEVIVRILNRQNVWSLPRCFVFFRKLNRIVGVFVCWLLRA